MGIPCVAIVDLLGSVNVSWRCTCSCSQRLRRTPQTIMHSPAQNPTKVVIETLRTHQCVSFNSSFESLLFRDILCRSLESSMTFLLRGRGPGLGDPGNAGTHAHQSIYYWGGSQCSCLPHNMYESPFDGEVDFLGKSCTAVLIKFWEWSTGNPIASPTPTYRSHSSESSGAQISHPMRESYQLQTNSSGSEIGTTSQRSATSSPTTDTTFMNRQSRRPACGLWGTFWSRKALIIHPLPSILLQTLLGQMRSHRMCWRLMMLWSSINTVGLQAPIDSLAHIDVPCCRNRFSPHGS